MLVNLKTILKIAEAKGCAVGSFNTPNLESIEAVIGAAEELNYPVIIMHAQIHEEMDICKVAVIGKIMIMMAERAKVPVCVHLDHGTDLSYLKKALDVGFTSVMFDGSELDYASNCANTCVAVEMAKKYGASVEAEIGTMGAREGGGVGGQSIYTDPETAKKFVADTGIDALACAFGTAHGVYTTKPVLDFERVSKIAKLVDVPLVMHGGSGVSEEDYKEVISRGIRKVNYYTYMAKSGGEAIEKMNNTTFYHDIAVKAKIAMYENAKSAMKIFMQSKEKNEDHFSKYYE